jgi:uncharacterized protein YqhQ
VINTGETYTVTYATTEGGSVNPPSQSDQVLSNEAITGSIATPNTGYKLLGLIPAIASIVVFLLTENMNNPMRLVDKWTILMVVMTLVNALLAYLTRNKKKDEDEEEAAAQ